MLFLAFVQTKNRFCEPLGCVGCGDVRHGKDSSHGIEIVTMCEDKGRGSVAIQESIFLAYEPAEGPCHPHSCVPRNPRLSKHCFRVTINGGKRGSIVAVLMGFITIRWLFPFASMARKNY